MKKPIPRPEKQDYHYPPWLWAAHNFHIYWPFGVCKIHAAPLISVLGFQHFPVKGGDRYGRLTSGAIRVLGQVCEVGIERNEPDKDGFTQGSWLLDPQRVPPGWYTLDYDELDIDVAIAMLCFLVGRKGERSDPAYALLLRRTNDCMGSHVYERIGAGMVGDNAPGTYQMPEITNTAAIWSHRAVMSQERKYF